MTEHRPKQSCHIHFRPIGLGIVIESLTWFWLAFCTLRFDFGWLAGHTEEAISRAQAWLPCVGVEPSRVVPNLDSGGLKEFRLRNQEQENTYHPNPPSFQVHDLSCLAPPTSFFLCPSFECLRMWTQSLFPRSAQLVGADLPEHLPQIGPRHFF